MKFKTLLLSIPLSLACVTNPASAQSVNFGDNGSQWAHDGECDDPRFEGQGMDEILLDEDRMHDASDCRALYQDGLIWLRDGGGSRSAPRSLSFGDNSSQWARDGECDDPRFAGSGMASVLLDEDRMHDADDCRSLYEAGNIYLK